jgi:hypothetical protein
VNSPVMDEDDLIGHLTAWLATTEEPTVAPVGNFGGRAALRALVRGVQIQINADTRRSAVSELIELAGAGDAVWRVRANRSGRFNKVVFRPDGRPTPGWYCYTLEDAPAETVLGPVRVPPGTEARSTTATRAATASVLPRTPDAETWQAPFLLPSLSPVTGTVFHYCSPDGLLGMVSHHELWATEASGMNDLAEVRQGWTYIRTWLEARTGDADDAVQRLAEVALTGDASSAGRPDGIFICSASRRGDDAAQWRLYGGRGYGYAVALDAAARLAVIGPGAEPDPIDHATQIGHWQEGTAQVSTATVSSWLPVLYTDEQKSAALEELTDAARTLLRSPESTTMSEGLIDDRLLAGLSLIANLMKSEGFAGEGEVRTVITVNHDTASSFRATATGGVVRYVRLTLAPEHLPLGAFLPAGSRSTSKRLPLAGVRMGPLIPVENNTESVRAVLRRHGYPQATCPVTASAVPLAHG